MVRKIALFLLLFLLVKPTLAFDPSLPNNKFGIHLAEPEDSDIQAASDLVNSTGGRWGYVTLVIQDTDRNVGKWQAIFDKLRQKRLIPIVRLATHPDGATWQRPTVEGANDWANFLNSLQWVVKDRYVVFFNEPNHGSEWGGQVDSPDYAKVAYAYAKALKDKNKDFFVMLAGLDASAPENYPQYEDEATFLTSVVNYGQQQNPKLFDVVDGWDSHSYPNPAFAGSPYATGRGTVKNYDWELSYLKDLGVVKDLPVFITETGWRHDVVPAATVGQYLTQAFADVWLPDGRVRAVTPFILNYQGDPFLGFSWKKPVGTASGGPDFYDHYYDVQNMIKVKGSPEQIEEGTVSMSWPRRLITSSSYHLTIHLKNDGQAIWDKGDGYTVKLEDAPGEYLAADLDDIAPHEESDVDLYLKTDKNTGKKKVHIGLYKNDKKILEAAEWQVEIVKPPSLTFSINLFPRVRSAPNRPYEIQIFNDSNEIVYKKRGIKLNGNAGTLDSVSNVSLGEKFRVVVLTEYYLPRQAFVTFQKGKNKVVFRPLLPVDYNRNGHLDWGDLGQIVKNPQVLRLWLP